MGSKESEQEGRKKGSTMLGERFRLDELVH